MQKSSSSSGLQHKAAHDPRTAAVKILREVLRGGTDTQAALNDALLSPSLMPTDKRLLTELVYGSLRNYLRLEGFLFSFLNKPEKLPEEMRLTLVLALYEIFFLRIPPHAAVNRAVQHVRNRFGQGLAKVANGALRAAQRSRKAFYAAEEIVAQTPAELSERYSVPFDLAALWLEQYGLEETRLLLKASLEKAPTGIRVNRARPDWQTVREDLLRTAEEYQGGGNRARTGGRQSTGLTGASETVKSDLPVLLAVTEAGSERGNESEPPDSLNTEAFTLPAPTDCMSVFFSRPPLQVRALEKNGQVSRQSAASYQALFALHPEAWPLPLWDACAGRGGKTLALLESGVSVALATDTSVRRLKALATEYLRLFPDRQPAAPILRSASAVDIFTVPPAAGGIFAAGDPYTIEDVEPTDAGRENTDEEVLIVSSVPEREFTAPLPSGVKKLFGTVLLDVPCSGFGTLARRPEIRFRRTREDIAQLIAVQKQLLDAAWTALLPEGLLIYMTCTRNRAENEDQIQAFLQRRPDAECLQEFSTSADSPLREFFYAVKLKKRERRNLPSDEEGELRRYPHDKGRV